MNKSQNPISIKFRCSCGCTITTNRIVVGCHKCGKEYKIVVIEEKEKI